MEASVSRKWKTIDMAYIALFAVLMAVCSWISIPAVVPFTLQTFGVFVAVSVLGGKRGTLAVVLYLLMGIVGLPVFAGFSGGLGVLLGSTGGYIIGFVFTALAHVAHRAASGDENMGAGAFHAAGACGVLCLRHRLVSGGVRQKHRRHRPVDGAGLVRVPLHSPGLPENRPCAGHPQASGRRDPAAVTLWMKQSISLRAHHGLCLHFFQGKGYSGAFVENMARKKAMLEENPLVRLTDQADEICRACPNNLCGQCESAEKVRRYDRAVLSLCGLTPGDVLPYRELAERVLGSILIPGRREDICGDCQWTDLCQYKEETP